MFLVLIFVLISLLCLQVFLQTRKPLNYPPGPRWLPFVGSLQELRALSRKLGGQHLALIELAKQYKTNVLGLKLGNELVIAVLSYPLVKIVLTEEEFQGRPDNFFLRLRCMGRKRGITCTDGYFWKIHRQFVTSHLRNLGFGKKSMEEMIQGQVHEILTILSNSQDVNVGKLLAPPVINILWHLITGSKINNTEQLDAILDLFGKRARAFDMSGGALSQYPWLRFLAPEKSGYNLIVQLNKEMKNLFMAPIQEHLKNYEPGKDSDLIYSFITEMKSNKESFDLDQLVMICLDLFIAGAQTTSNTLDFAMLLMLKHPEVQEKVHNCLKVLDNPFIEYSDRHKVDYVQAVLMEVERYLHVTPIIGPRRVLKETTLDGYSIPKNSTVLISTYSVHHDAEYWKDPEKFNPDRFLDQTGLIVKERFIPFGLGKRRCLGEVLARSCIFIFFAEIMRRFKIVPEGTIPSTLYQPGITLTPVKYKARFLAK